MSNSTLDCSTKGSCPFAYTEESEYAQSVGCGIASPIEILYMRVAHNKTWACHSNPDKPCLGTINRLKELKLDFKVIDPVLVTDGDDWSIYAEYTEDFRRDIMRRDMNNVSDQYMENASFNRR